MTVVYKLMDSGRLEKYSSAITLSDMEIFVFPELMYALVLANIISPVIWRWRQRNCFKKLSGKSSYKKLMRLKQFVMDEYEFNLDLETWGLTSRQKELRRFEKHISSEQIAASNALFGYHGDKYYFDVDIRRHFGLDKYDSDIIPYWKTETVEAMDAFSLKNDYKSGAGECVSLAALYAAAAFIVCDVPLEDIYMILTPLHSQNFIDLNGGVLTNNRRLVTRSMWFNGTAISNKAQRALRNENATIIAHSTGYIHCVYDEATIDKHLYQKFSRRLQSYLTTELDLYIFASFLRTYPQYQKFFQACKDCHGQPHFTRSETLFHYEHSSKFRIDVQTYDKLLDEISDEDFVPYELADRIRCDKLSEFISKNNINLKNAGDRQALREFVEPVVPDAEQMVSRLADFVHTKARLPAPQKNYLPTAPVKINPSQSREQIIEYLNSIRRTNVTADLAFYVYRDMQNCDWQPFVKAAVERNPVSLEMMKSKSVEQVYRWLSRMGDESIYEGMRLAQPDEVANYNTGDGLEKAFVLANILRNKGPEEEIEIVIENKRVIVRATNEYHFATNKGLDKRIIIPPTEPVTGE